MSRGLILILDSLGIGGAPDANLFDVMWANTLVNIFYSWWCSSTAAPKYKADNIVKIYACNAHTSNSNKHSANASPNESAPPIQLWKINISPNILIKTTCPAVMLAYSLIINENGLIMVPKSSIGASIIFIGVGTPGIQKICIQ